MLNDQRARVAKEVASHSLPARSSGDQRRASTAAVGRIISPLKLGGGTLMKDDPHIKPIELSISSYTVYTYYILLVFLNHPD